LEETSRATLAELETRIQNQENQLRDRQQLTSEMAKREDSVAARESDLHRVEGEQKTDIENLQLRLQDAEAKLVSQDRTLKEKETGIHAAALREKEIGKLIERLSSECEKLSAKLCEKELIISRLEDTTRYYFFNGAKAWGKILRVVQVGRLLLTDIPKPS
jgi:hypothetical protein